jgi:hypothetical protein
MANGVRIAESGKNANCRLILNPDWTIEEDGKQTRVILTTTMRVEKRLVPLGSGWISQPYRGRTRGGGVRWGSE